jgi:magnesium transporter
VLTVLACTEGNYFVPVSPGEVPRLLDTAGSLVWVDLEAPAPDEIAILSDVFHFHQLTIDDCLNSRVDPPKIDDYGEYLFLIAQGIDVREGGAAVTTTELNLYIGHSYVVSFHHRPLAAIEETRLRCERQAPLPARGADWLAHSMLDTLVDHLLPVVEQMDEDIADLEDEALVRPSPDLISRVSQMKRSIIRLRRLVAPQREVVNRLSRGDYTHLVREETHMYYRDIYDHLVRLDEVIEGLRDLGDSVVTTYLSTVNNRMNEIMKALSVVGTIFLPLTLVASVFGTNFSPTYEAWGWSGFAVMCLAMLAAAGLALWWFRRRHWI